MGIQGGVTPKGAVSTAATGVKMRSSCQGTLEGSVKRSSSEKGATVLCNAVIFDRSAHGEASHCACAFVYDQRVKDENWGWSSGQVQFSAVKYLDPDRSCGHSAYWSNPPRSEFSLERCLVSIGIAIHVACPLPH